MPSAPLNELEPGMIIPFGGTFYTQVSPELAVAFQPGDELAVVQDTGDLLHIPAEVRSLVDEQVQAAYHAFEGLRLIDSSHVETFYREFAARLEDPAIWGEIHSANERDVARARSRGRSTTRLEISDGVRESMAEGLRTWAEYLGQADDGVLERLDHEGWSVTTRRAPLGVIGFVFEGRPNVFADAAGVLATGNTAVLRIGGDALETAAAITQHALNPALAQAELPVGAVSLIPTRERSAGWALFSDRRLALAVVRGSGEAVTQLSSVARQSGIPVSAHGTGGAWVVADESADRERLAQVIRYSLDRKVCNTVNVVVLPRSRAIELAPVVLAAADDAARVRGGQAARLHVERESIEWIQADEFERTIEVQRADGIHREPRASVIEIDHLGTEWEWENTPELSVVVVDGADEAAAAFNSYSPQFVASFIASDDEARDRFESSVNAPFVGDGFTRWVDGQYALNQPELGLSNWQNGRLLARGAILTGADLVTYRVHARHESARQHR